MTYVRTPAGTSEYDHITFHARTTRHLHATHRGYGTILLSITLTVRRYVRTAGRAARRRPIAGPPRSRRPLDSHLRGARATRRECGVARDGGLRGFARREAKHASIALARPLQMGEAPRSERGVARDGAARACWCTRCAAGARAARSERAPSSNRSGLARKAGTSCPPPPSRQTT